MYYMFQFWERREGLLGSWGSWGVLRGPAAVWDHEHRFQYFLQNPKA